MIEYGQEKRELAYTPWVAVAYGGCDCITACSGFYRAGIRVGDRPELGV